MKKVIVTGGIGFIGSHTVVELVNAGYTPIIIDNLSNSSRQILGQIEKITGTKIEFHEFDLCDKEKTKAFVDAHPEVEKVIHFAALKAVGESVSEPLKYYKNNLESLLNLLEALSDREVDFVFSSSCTVYGEAKVQPVTEETPIQKAECPYGNTKKIAEDILVDLSQAKKNFHIIALRYFNPAGAHSSALIGELPQGIPQNIIPFLMQSAIGKRGPLTVFGNDYDTPDGTTLRDYIHVVDLARAHVAALKKLEEKKGANFDVFNLSTGKANSLFEVIKTFEEATGVKLNYKIGPRRAGDLIKIWGDPSKANRELDWKAELGLKDMLISAWAWEKYIKDNPIS